MNQREENWMSMVFAVLKFFEGNLSKFVTGTPVLPGLVNELKAIVEQIEKADGTATQDDTGIAYQKELYRLEMSDTGIIVATGLNNFFMANDDELMAQQAHRTLADFKNGLEAVILYKAECLLKLADEYAGDIVPFGVSGAELEAYRTAITPFKEIIGKPMLAMQKRKKFRGDEKKLFADMLKVLKKIDNTVKQHVGKFPNECVAYKKVRKNPNNRSGKHLVPDKKATLKSLEKIVLLKDGFDVSNSIMVKNNGKGDLIWGNTSTENGFSGKNILLTAGKVSIYKVKTLGADGTMIMVENKNNFPVAIELFILKNK